MQRKFLQSAPPSYANPLVVMTWGEGQGQRVEEVAGQLWQCKGSLPSSLRLCIPAAGKLSRELRQCKEDTSSSLPVQAHISAVRSRCSSTERKEYGRCTPLGILLLYLHYHEEAGWKIYSSARGPSTSAGRENNPKGILPRKMLS